MTEDQINHLLWRIDPMNTCCNVNDGMENEYEMLVATIAEALDRGTTPRQAVLTAFDEAFWAGCLLEPHRQTALAELLAALGR